MLEKKAYFYVCGDAANMAREVNAVLAQIIAEQRGISETKAEEVVKNMRAANQYQVRCQLRGDIRGSLKHFASCPFPSFLFWRRDHCAKHFEGEHQLTQLYRRMCGLNRGSREL